MSQFYSDIKATFTQQLDMTKQLIQIADEKTEAIKQNDVALIMQLTKKEEECARTMITLEKNRDMQIKLLEKEKNIKIDNLSNLLGDMNPGMSVGINLIAEELKYNLEILKNKNDINHMLMSFILEQIEIANNIIRGDRIPNTYSNTKYNKKNYGNDKVDISYFDSKY